MKYIPLLIVFINISVPAQYQTGNFNVSFNINYTTSAKVYLNPNSSDIDLRNRSIEYSDLISPAVDIRYSITNDLLLGLNVELIRKTRETTLNVISDGDIREIPMKDGFRVIPLEFFIHYVMPFSTEQFKFLIGGGLAYYYGEHVREYSGETVSNLKRNFAYGIQVSVSSDYMLTPFLSVRGEMKFRDPEYQVTSTYHKRELMYNGQQVRIVQEKFESKINIDGITFTLGMAFHF